MDSLLRQWDGEELIARFDRPSGAWVLVAVHSTRLGPATGGTRMRSYPDVRAAVADALALAAGMTRKFAVAGFPAGGGKAVLAVPAGLEPGARTELLLRYGTLVRQLGGLFRTGPDVGTSPADMDVIARTGAPFIYSRTEAAGGPGDSAPATALGVMAGLEVVCEQLDGRPELAGLRILVQGAGSVGRRLAGHLVAAGAEVLVSDPDQAALRACQEALGVRAVDPALAAETECDIFAPCALGGLLDAAAVERLRCRAVAGAANNPLAGPEQARRLHERGILYAPDYVLNIGGAVAITGRETQGWTPEEAEQRVVQTVRRTLREVFRRARAAGQTPEAAARQMADERLAAARAAEESDRAGAPGAGPEHDRRRLELRASAAS